MNIECAHSIYPCPPPSPHPHPARQNQPRVTNREKSSIKSLKVYSPLIHFFPHDFQIPPCIVLIVAIKGPYNCVLVPFSHSSQNSWTFLLVLTVSASPSCRNFWSCLIVLAPFTTTSLNSAAWDVAPLGISADPKQVLTNRIHFPGALL